MVVERCVVALGCCEVVVSFSEVVVLSCVVLTGFVCSPLLVLDSVAAVSAVVFPPPFIAVCVLSDEVPPAVVSLAVKLLVLCNQV